MAGVSLRTSNARDTLDAKIEFWLLPPAAAAADDPSVDVAMVQRLRLVLLQGCSLGDEAKSYEG